MTTVSNETIESARIELVSIIMRLVNTIEEGKASQIANDIVRLIDWNNSALMHKGLSWMAKNYLIQHNVLV